MPKENAPLIAFNRGLISKLALAREDLKRTALSAEIFTNWMPRVLGSMMLRPGLQYINQTKDNKKAVNISFIFSTDDYASIEMTDSVMRIVKDDAVVKRVGVSAVVADGDFSSLSGWTDDHDSGASASIVDDELNLVGTGFGSARIRQEVTVAIGQDGREHALEINVTRGPVRIRVGSASGGDQHVFETSLGTGIHNLAFFPTGSLWIEFISFQRYTVIVDQCILSIGGVLEIDTPYIEDDLEKIREESSADVVYLACKGYQQKKIERRSNNSWSFVDYESNDGPFRLINISQTSITPSGLNGDITLTSSENLFRESNVGSLYQITSRGQSVENTFNGANQEGDYIRVTGVGSSQRQFTMEFVGNLIGTLTLQRSSGSPGNWIDVKTFVDPSGSSSFYDGSTFANQIIFYRLIVKSGDYTSGTEVVSIDYDDGGITGVVRVVGFTSEKLVDAIVLSSLGRTTSTTDWSEGKWSERRKRPTSCILHQGRFWWFGNGNTNGSVSDAFESFDPDVEGDSAPIDRSIGSGPVDDIEWGLSLNRLLVGTAGSELSIKSSSLDEPITRSSFNFGSPSTQGSAKVQARKADSRGYFVQKSGIKLYNLSETDSISYDYTSEDMMALVPEIGEAGIKRIQIQRQPDTRIHCVLADGTVAILVLDPAEDVLCWLKFETDGLVEEVDILPGLIEDTVHYTVKRIINGVTKRYREKWALEKDCRGGLLNKQADSFFLYEGESTTIINNIDHLNTKEVVVWGDGKDLGKYIVSNGTIELTESVTQAVIGLEYVAQFKSAKLKYASAAGTALTQVKTYAHVGLVLEDTHYQGLMFGHDFNTIDNDENMESLPLVGENDEDIEEHTVFDAVDVEKLPVEHGWTTDSRLCLEARAPRPCTVLACVVDQQTNG